MSFHWTKVEGLYEKLSFEVSFTACYYIILQRAASYAKGGRHWWVFLLLHPYRILCLTDAEGGETQKKKTKQKNLTKTQEGVNLMSSSCGKCMQNLLLHGQWIRLIRWLCRSFWQCLPVCTWVHVPPSLLPALPAVLTWMAVHRQCQQGEEGSSEKLGSAQKQCSGF